MDMNKSWDLSVTWETTSSNEEWRNIIDFGMEAPFVSGDSIKLPQGGERKSKAAITGGIFTEGSEAATYAEENGNKIISSVLKTELEDRMIDLLNGSDVGDLEFFLTNIMKNEYMKIANEFSDNPDEALATEMVVNSICVKIHIKGLPTIEEITNEAKESVVKLIQNSLGGNVL